MKKLRIPRRRRLRPMFPPGTSTGAAASPSLPVIVAASFDRLDLRQRARMLGRLLASVGPLALAVVGGGAFAKYATHARWPEIPVTIEDAARATSGQIHRAGAVHRAKQPAASTTCWSRSPATRRRSPRWALRSPRSPSIGSLRAMDPDMKRAQ